MLQLAQRAFYLAKIPTPFHFAREREVLTRGGAMQSDADTVPMIIEEIISFRHSEREKRATDNDKEGSMEIKKREGYF